jgi:hypothetical protein
LLRSSSLPRVYADYFFFVCLRVASEALFRYSMAVWYVGKLQVPHSVPAYGVLFSPNFSVICLSLCFIMATVSRNVVGSSFRALRFFHVSATFSFMAISFGLSSLAVMWFLISCS